MALGSICEWDDHLPEVPRTPRENSVIQDVNESRSFLNIDVIPGLAYDAPATGILGKLYGSNDLEQRSSLSSG